MARLPIVGSDDGTWGDLLNEYLSVQHASGGEHKAITVPALSATTDDAFKAKLTADTQYQFIINADGKQEWGPGGTTAPDTNLYRSAADTLKTDDAFIVGGSMLSVAGGPVSVSYGGGKATLALSSTGADTGLTLGGDTNLYRSAAEQLKTDGALVSDRSASTQLAFGVLLSAAWALQIKANGLIQWSSDTNLYRSAADTLKTDDALVVAGVATASNSKRGAGSPESIVTGNVGDVYQRTDGSTGTTLYVKESGTGNTGWVAVAAGVTAHSALTGLAADDHPQYHNDARGDARYQAIGDSGLLAVTAYEPSPVDINSTSATLSDVDATNLAVTFTVPSSGKVLVRLVGRGSVTATDTLLGWGLRESSSIIAGPARVDGGGLAGSVRDHSVDFLITGLTPGASKTYKMAHAREAGPGTAQTRLGQGPTTIQVWAAP